MPVSADLENGFGDSPETVAKTIQAAASVGLVGCSIEDATGDPNDPVYEHALAVERIGAAVEAAQSLSFSFTLTARAENYLYGRHDLDDTIRRLQDFEALGADVLYAPGLPEIEAIRTVCASVTKPVNVVIGSRRTSFPVAELDAAGVRRISLGSSLCRAALGSFLRAAREIADDGTFTFVDEAAAFTDLNSFMAGRTA